MAKCPFCGQEIVDPAIYDKNRKKMIENGKVTLERIDKIKAQNKILVENVRNNGSIYVKKKVDIKQQGKKKESLHELLGKIKLVDKNYENLYVDLKKKYIYKDKIDYPVKAAIEYFQKNQNDSFVTFNPNKQMQNGR